MKTVTPFNQIEPELLSMQKFLEMEYDTSNDEMVLTRAQKLEHIVARSGKLCADARYHRDVMTSTAIMDTLKESLAQGGYSPSLINKKVDSLCMDFNYIEKWAERVNRTSTHQLEFSRTVISNNKAKRSLI
jgi:hypothetical protein